MITPGFRGPLEPSNSVVVVVVVVAVDVTVFSMGARTKAEISIFARNSAPEN